MNSSATTSVKRHSILKWLLIGLGFCLAPFVALAIVVASYITLDRDLAVLRGRVMATIDGGWKTKIQISLGRTTINAVNFGLGFVHDKKEIADARLALTGLRRASVGIYKRESVLSTNSPEQLFTAADQAMQKRGWTRAVGVRAQKDTVLVYIPQNMKTDDRVEICLAVVSDKELVLVSTNVDPFVLEELVKHHFGDRFKSEVRLTEYPVKASAFAKAPRL